MGEQAISLQLPMALYRQLAEVADFSQRPLTEVVIQSIQVGLPPSLAHIPERFRADVGVLSQLDDTLLWQIVQQALTDDKAERYEELLLKNQQEVLSPTEQVVLDTLREEADLLMFRRSYAYALLKWRGHRIPTLGEMYAPTD